MYEQNYDNLELIIVKDKARRKQNCGNYKYLVHHRCFSHTAFRSKSAMKNWLKERGLTIGKRYSWGHSWKLEGSYTDSIHMLDKPDLLKWFIDNKIKLTGKSVTFSNGDYTDSWIEDRNGKRVIHYINPNCKRSVYDYRKMSDVFCGPWEDN